MFEQTYDLANLLHRSYQPSEGMDFYRTGNFENLATYQFFFTLLRYLDTRLRPPLQALLSIAQLGVELRSSVEKSHGLDQVPDFNHQRRVLDQMAYHAEEIVREGIESLKETLATTYKFAAKKFQYLWARFTEQAPEKRRDKFVLFEFEEEMDIKLDDVAFTPMRLFKDNAMLTDLLLELSRHVPDRVEQRKARGKKHEKRIPEGKLRKAEDIFLEVAERDFFVFAREPNKFMIKVMELIKTYREIIATCHEPLTNFLQAHVAHGGVGVRSVETDCGYVLKNIDAFLAAFNRIVFGTVKPVLVEESMSESRKQAEEVLHGLFTYLFEAISTLSRTPADERKEKVTAIIQRAAEMKEEHENISTVRHKRRKSTPQYEKGGYFTIQPGEKSSITLVPEARPKETIYDVIGASFDPARRHIEKVLARAQTVSLYQTVAPRGKIGGNTILIGPYGCGKTMFARGIAANRAVAAIQGNVGNMMSKWLGDAENNMNSLFTEGRKVRDQTGKIVFLILDELDSWFIPKDGRFHDNATMNRFGRIMQQKLDGMEDFDGIPLLGMTNQPQDIGLEIYRRCEYVALVGELTNAERGLLLQKLLRRKIPVEDFSDATFTHYGELMKDATGHVIGSIADTLGDIYIEELWRRFPRKARFMDRQIFRWRTKEKDPPRRWALEHLQSQFSLPTSQVQRTIEDTMKEPNIVAQIRAARTVYNRGTEVLAQLGGYEVMGFGVQN